MAKIFFHPSLLLLFLDPGSGFRDPGSGMGKNQDPGSGINIPDPQHVKGGYKQNDVIKKWLTTSRFSRWEEGRAVPRKPRNTSL